MKTILIISPCFPPTNTPDMHRVRLSIPWFKIEGWRVKVLAVQPKYIEANVDPILKQLPDPCAVIRVNAYSTKFTRLFGLGNLGYRSWLQIRRAGNRILNKEKIDIIYFSTTVFPTMTLGRIWQKKYGIPFVIDMQDPWRNDFYLSQPKHNRPPKYKIAHFLDTILEKWTIPHAGGLISVSEKYPETLNKRYNTSIPSKIITFSASQRDFDLVTELQVKNPVFQKEKGLITLVYTGAVTPGMPIPLEQTLLAIKKYTAQQTSNKLRVFFIGTTYDPSATAQNKVTHLIKKLALEKTVFEIPSRQGYFETIKILLDSDGLLLPGSIEAGYTASKIYTYILSKKPIFAVINENSSVSKILRECNAGTIITFSTPQDLQNKQKILGKTFEHFASSLPNSSDINWTNFDEYSDKTMAHKQLTFFHKIITNE